MDDLAQILSSAAGPASGGDVQPDSSSPTGFRNSRGQFVSPNATGEQQPMDQNADLVRALTGTGSPEEMEQMRRYQEMLRQRPSFAPTMPRAQAAAGAAKVPMDELSAVLAGNQRPMGGFSGMGGALMGPAAQQAMQQMPMQGMHGMPQGEELGLLDHLRNMGPGLQQLYGPRR